MKAPRPRPPQTISTTTTTRKNRYLENLNEFAAVGDKMYVRVKGVDEEGRLALSYEAREKDRPKPPNRRQRRGAARGEGMLGWCWISDIV